jgi:hypothetical protein
MRRVLVPIGFSFVAGARHPGGRFSAISGISPTSGEQPVRCAGQKGEERGFLIGLRGLECKARGVVPEGYELDREPSEPNRYLTRHAAET